MEKIESFIESGDGLPLYLYRWLPAKEQSLQGIVHICHGMSEHAGRYQRLAHRLVEAGFGVYAHDCRGHGKTAEQGHPGDFAEHHGWQKVIEDIGTIQALIKHNHPDTDRILLGHSMGSYIAQGYLLKHPDELKSVVLSGSNFAPRPLLYFGKLTAWFEQLRSGPLGQSALIDKLTFASYNRYFRPARTDFDWLSSLPEEVDLYINDPLCGDMPVNRLWLELFKGLIEISQINNLKALPATMKVLIIGGDKDPISHGNRLQKLAEAYRKAGIQAVTEHIYSNGRHEMFNECNREEVTEQLIGWLKQG